MGWGQGKFPIFTQLNVLTNSGHIDDTHAFFVATYGSNGKNYTVGDLCYDWRPASKPTPPWQKTPPGWDATEAGEWKVHCQGSDLSVANAGSDHTGSKTGNSVAEDLTNWIREAILAKERIIYKFHRDDELDPPWKADRIRAGDKRWRITVTGPGWS